MSSSEQLMINEARREELVRLRAENERLLAIALDVKRAACDENGPVNFQTAIDNLIAYLEEKP